jgi:hypothetical protein
VSNFALSVVVPEPAEEHNRREIARPRGSAINCELARQVLNNSADKPYCSRRRRNTARFPEIPMDIFASSDSPPTDFVAFLAQRGGLSAEAAEHRLERWFGEYHAASSQRPVAYSTRHLSTQTG